MGKYITRNVYNQRVDKETGEIMEYVEKVEVTRKDAEPFFLTYSKQIMALYGKSIFNATTKVLWKFLEFAEYNTGKVYMTAERREEILNDCDIKKTSYHRAVNELIEEGLLTKNKDTYTINEDMFWKGDRKAREELKNAKLQIAFSAIFNEPLETV